MPLCAYVNSTASWSRAFRLLLSGGESLPQGLLLCETPAGGSFALLTLIARGKERKKIGKINLAWFYLFYFNRASFLVLPSPQTEALETHSRLRLSFISIHKVLALSLSAACSTPFAGTLQMCSIEKFTFNYCYLRFCLFLNPTLSPSTFCFLLVILQRKNW